MKIEVVGVYGFYFVGSGISLLRVHLSCHSLPYQKYSDLMENANMEILRTNEGTEGNALVSEMMEVIEMVGSYMGYRRIQRKECLRLVRRLKLLVPLFEEIKELNQ